MPDLTADDRVLDRRIPKDWAHVERHPLRLAAVALAVPTQLEVILDIPLHCVAPVPECGATLE